MKKLKWNMEEVFYFPENVGVPKDARVVKVKAGFTEKRSDDAVRLSGIYHITAKLDFTEGQRREEFPSEAVFVDDVELDGGTGYFEYAVPLYIDLPPETGHPLNIEATDVKSTFDGQGAFTVAWNVNCMHGEAAGNETASDLPANAETEAIVEKKETAAVQEAPKETAALQEPPKEMVAVGARENSEEVASAASQSSAMQNRTAAVPVQDTQSAAIHDSTSNGQDDILSYIAALPDERTTSRFRSNDVLVKEES